MYHRTCHNLLKLLYVVFQIHLDYIAEPVSFFAVMICINH